MSVSNSFLRKYKLLFGISPHKFLTERRLQEASRLLHHSYQTVTDICQQVGFESLGTFSYPFSKKYGFSPTHFRKKGDFQEVCRS